MPAIQNLLSNTLLRYILVGGTGVLFELFVIFAMKNWLGASDELAVTVSFWAGVAFSFLLQKFFAFDNKEVRIKALSKQAFFYALLLAVNYLFTLLFVNLTAGFWGVYIARMVALVITTAWNFLVYKYLVFKK